MATPPLPEIVKAAYEGESAAVTTVVKWALEGLAEGGQIDLAQAVLNGLAARLESNRSKEQLAQTYFGLGRVLAKCDRHLDAAKAFERASEVYDKRSGLFCRRCAANRALAMARAGIDPKDIRREFKADLQEKLKDMQGEPAAVYLALGLLNFAADCRAEASAFWKAAEKNGTTEERAIAATNLASLHIVTDRLKDADGDIERAEGYGTVVTSKTTFEVAKADVAAVNKRWKEAKTYLEKVLDVEPNRGRALYRMGILAALQGDYAEAEEWLQRTLSVEPWHAKAQADLTRAQLAREGGIGGGFLARRPRLRLALACLIVAVGVAAMVPAALCQSDKSTIESTERVEPTPAGATAQTVVAQEGAAPAQATSGPGPTSTPSLVLEQRVTTKENQSAKDIPTGFLAIGTLVIALGAILLLLPEVRKLTIGPVEVEPIEAAAPRPFFTEWSPDEVETLEQARASDSPMRT